MRFFPQKLLQTPGRQKASVARLIPRCSSPLRAPTVHLLPRIPELHLLPRLPELHRQRRNRSPASRKEEEIPHTPWAPGAPAPRAARLSPPRGNIDAADERRTGTPRGLKRMELLGLLLF